MRRALTYQHTIRASELGYITQSVVNNLAPLLFLIFQQQFAIPLSRITLLITFNFCIQLLIDSLSARFVDRIGYRTCILAAHVFCATGLIGMAVLPHILPSAYAGLLCAVVCYAIGGGLIEVLISPIVEACPTDNKQSVMSMLHSFYCWGHVGVVLLSTAFFSLFGTENWKILALIWAAVPVLNTVLFAKVPIYPLVEEGETGLTFKELFASGVFRMLLVMMICAGASEQAVSQWASAFAEKGLGVSKTVGDLAGPMAFAVLMGLSRLIYGKYGHRFDLDRFMKYSCFLCIGAYLCITLVPNPVISLIGCAVCGFSVGIMWPGTFSKASASIKGGGTAMFALLALAGDVGCSGGPTLAGFVSDRAGGNMKAGILAAMIFPVVMTVCLFAEKRKAD